MKEIVLTLLVSATLCLGAVSNANRNRTDIRGKITNIHRSEAGQRSIGTILVEAEDKEAKVDKANLIITEKTRILKEHDGKRLETGFDELKQGQLVEAEFVEGPTIMIYPLRVEAKEIVIIKAGE
jgi:hypothetical protein